MTRIIIFAKAPVPGEVKTRLIPALGAKGAAELAERMLAATCREAVAAAVGPRMARCRGPPLTRPTQAGQVEHPPAGGAPPCVERLLRA